MQLSAKPSTVERAAAATARGSQRQKEINEEITGASMLTAMNKKLNSLLSLMETGIGIKSSVQMMSKQFNHLMVYDKNQDKEIKDQANAYLTLNKLKRLRMKL